MPRCAMKSVLNDDREALLMVRHQWIIDTAVGVYRALLEDRGSVAGRTPESAGLRSPNGSTPPTPSKG